MWGPNSKLDKQIPVYKPGSFSEFEALFKKLSK